MTRVFVTGLGCISPIGNSVAEFRDSVFSGRSGIRPLPAFPGPVNFSRAGLVVDFTPELLLTPSQMAISERCSQMGVAAAQQALAASGVLGHVSGDEIAIVVGCSTAGRSVEEAETAKLYTSGLRVHPLTVPRVMASSGTSLISMGHGITGPAYTVTTACASATHAIGQAFQMVRSGAVTAAVCGGHEAPLTYGFLKAWEAIRVVSTAQCRPFAAGRDGMTLAEGAAMLVLESEQSALDRGAPVFGEICGFGMSSDAHHITQANAAGPAAAMRMALRDAGARPEDVAYINAHGTGTEVNDRVEAEAIRGVFGSLAGHVPVSSTKALHGHAMGASGALEALATVLALQAGRAPGNWIDGAVDPALGLNVLGPETAEVSGTLALSNSFAFGGLNAVIALRRVEEIL